MSSTLFDPNCPTLSTIALDSLNVIYERRIVPLASIDLTVVPQIRDQKFVPTNLVRLQRPLELADLGPDDLPQYVWDDKDIACFEPSPGVIAALDGRHRLHLLEAFAKAVGDKNPMVQVLVCQVTEIQALSLAVDLNERGPFPTSEMAKDAIIFSEMTGAQNRDETAQRLSKVFHVPASQIHRRFRTSTCDHVFRSGKAPLVAATPYLTNDNKAALGSMRLPVLEALGDVVVAASKAVPDKSVTSSKRKFNDLVSKGRTTMVNALASGAGLDAARRDAVKAVTLVRQPNGPFTTTHSLNNIAGRTRALLQSTKPSDLITQAKALPAADRLILAENHRKMEAILKAAKII